MEATVALTSRWQIYIPKEMRTVFGAKKPGQVRLKTSKNKLVVTTQKSRLLFLAGKYHKYYLRHQNVDVNRIRDYIDYSQA